MQQTIGISPSNDPRQGGSNSEASTRYFIDLLLKLEADVRCIESPEELSFLIANETANISRARQIFVFAKKSAEQRIVAVSSVGKVERNSLRIRWIESIVKSLEKDVSLDEVREFTLPAYCPPNDEEHKKFPYQFIVWFPLQLRDGYVFGGMLLSREVPWTQADILITSRLAKTYSHAWAALTGSRRLKKSIRLKPILGVSLLTIVVAGFIPVSLSVLAPAEIAPLEPRVVAAPMDGVIESIEVEPNASVNAGQLLLRMSDVMLQNELAVAKREVNVAEAKLKQVTQGAVADPKIRGDMAVAGTELSLAGAKREYAGDLLNRTRVISPQTGVVIYTDKRDWIGRPVSTGERIMEVADPSRIQIRIDVPVADAIAVMTGAEVRAFLDSDPLRPVQAKVRSTSFEAQMTESNTLAYRVYADIPAIEGEKSGMRIGIRGTAQIFGGKVPLAFYLFRRPIAAIRQRIGL